MKDKILGLVLLQDCDNGINKLDSLKKECPLKILKLEEELNAYRMNFENDNDRLESLRKERRKAEQIAQELEGKLEKSRIKLGNIKSNKEYAAALKEIEDMTREKEKVEDGILDLMEEIEKWEKKCLENGKELERFQRNFDLDKKRIEEDLDRLNKESVVLEKKRQKLSHGIEGDLLSKYDFLKVRKNGVAIASVIGAVCQLCHMNIPPQRFNELIRCNSLMSCPNCHRLIYWGEDEFFIKALGNPADSSAGSL